MIQRAARERAATLDLSGRGLRRLPEAIARLSELRELWVHDNPLGELPEWIGEMRGLRALGAWRCGLTRAPESIGRLRELRTLALSSNRLAGLPESIWELAELRELVLHTNRLEELRGGIGRLGRLEVLRVDDNRLEALPEEIGSLARLRELRVDFNRLEGLPESVGALGELTYLNARGNRIARLPGAIGGCARLKTLVLHDNPIEELPDEIGGCGELERLFVTDGRLERLPERIGDCGALETIDLRFNRLTSIPKRIGELSRLRTLLLSGNRLRELPSELGRIETLRLNGNPLTAPPEGIKRGGAEAGSAKEGAAPLARIEEGEKPPREGEAKENAAREKKRPWLARARDAMTGWAVGPAAWACARLGHRGAMRLGRAVGAMAHLAAGEERRIAKRNLEIVKEETFIARRGRGLARRSFVELGANLAEAAHAARWTLDDYRRRIDFDGVEHWRAAFERARGVIVVSAHLGAWELIAPALLAHVVAQPPPAGIPQIEAIARPARNARIDALARRLRERFGLKVHAREGLQLGYLRTLSRGGALLVLGDQDTRRAEAIAVRFFGRPTMTPVGPAWLARRTGAAVLPAFIERRKDDPTRHRLAFKAPIFPDDRLDEEADRFRMTQAATREIEAAIRATPEGWTWMHDRWMRDPKKMLRDEEIELGANERRMEGGEEGS